jgi:hypothetical protein
MNNISERERFRRREQVRDARAALAQNESVEQRLKARNAKAEAWTQWFRHKMDATRCQDPLALLPEALALFLAEKVAEACDANDLTNLNQLSDMHVRESKAVGDLSTKLKLTKRTRMTPEKAAHQQRLNSTPGVRPWEGPKR